jgi:hypothetical protein
MNAVYQVADALPLALLRCLLLHCMHAGTLWKTPLTGKAVATDTEVGNTAAAAAAQPSADSCSQHAWAALSAVLRATLALLFLQYAVGCCMTQYVRLIRPCLAPCCCW